ncbi:hypothetical protein [Caminibacter pacificus]|uniref:Uncharacterized protein n=1 Tax=Caminibacter pacificus TaxID=1424653 RepID=A0AAJ4RC48_9BACT|nr:hypothetical protein [Caminibacter pacificus]ROR39795.1 hypothetical protein EDC58_0770 [Caminibacter pacificus]
MKTRVNKLKQEILTLINKKANVEIAIIKLYTIQNNDIEISYYEDCEINGMLKALKIIDEKEFLSFLENLSKMKCKIFTKNYPVCKIEKEKVEIIDADYLPF